jgi:ribosomal protein L11 methyltransferase
MRWIELSAKADSKSVETIASILGFYGQGGAVVEEWQTETEPETTYIVKMYLVHSRSYPETRSAVERHLSSLPLSPSVQLEERLLKPDEWLDSLKKDFKVLEIGEKVIVKPSWEKEPAQTSGKVVIELDPGAAFGTGLHSTTRLCLLRLEKLLRPGTTILDLGTGSGILAIAAAKLGAAEVLALDIDPVAVKAAQRNTRTNKVDYCVRVRRGTLSTRAQKQYRVAFDIVLANITSRAISDLSQNLAKVLKPGGRLVASGIHPQGLDEVLIRLALADFTIESIGQEGEWFVVVAVCK